MCPRQLRVLMGIAASPTYPGSAQGVSRWVMPQFQGRANGIVIAAIGLGSALAPPLVSNIMVTMGWHAALIASAIPALIIALIWLRIKEPENINSFYHAEKKGPDPEEKGKIRSVSFYLLTISYTLQGYVGYIFVTWFYLYLVQERHFGLRRIDFTCAYANNSKLYRMGKCAACCCCSGWYRGVAVGRE